MTAIIVSDAKQAKQQTRQLQSDAADAAAMLELHREVLTTGVAMLQKSKQLGDKLLAKKAAVGHGQWGHWCRQYLPEMSQTHAGNYMRIAQRWDDEIKGYLANTPPENLSLRGAIAFLQEAQEQDHPGKDEIMRMWAEAIQARFSSRRGKYPIVVDVADEDFGRDFSFPKSFKTWKHCWEHWQEKGQRYTEGLAKIQERRAQTVKHQTAVERPASSVVPFVAPETPRRPQNDLQIQSHSAPEEDTPTGHSEALAAIFCDLNGAELAVGDRVIFFREPNDERGTIVGIDPTADLERYIHVVWDGEDDWIPCRPKTLIKVDADQAEPESEAEPEKRVEVVSPFQLDEYAQLYSADKLMKNQIRGVFPWGGFYWVCTGTLSSGEDGTLKVDAVKVVPLNDWQGETLTYADLETLTYADPCDLKLFSYAGQKVSCRGKSWVLTGEEIEFRSQPVDRQAEANPKQRFEFEVGAEVQRTDRQWFQLEPLKTISPRQRTAFVIGHTPAGIQLAAMPEGDEFAVVQAQFLELVPEEPEPEEPQFAFDYDDYVTGPDKQGTVRTGWVIQSGYEWMWVTDDDGKAAYDRGAHRDHIENCWPLRQETARHCEPGESLADDGEPAIEVEAATTDEFTQAQAALEAAIAEALPVLGADQVWSLVRKMTIPYRKGGSHG
jgi:hypothetical protein